ncbi:hypothetical protein SCHPADRAFT_744550 [Schizopora paradoxa]|uniref:F-box domain-containing protein n=1 Tax=Schizopora paradoxa TaxID=27342 RepID=A0A0H2RIZ9_9AGAM|nr:hypothetical protein SCHPADRAFT_744550 [Schizopora paradoxa]
MPVQFPSFLDRLSEEDRKFFFEVCRKNKEKLRADVLAVVTKWIDSDCKVALPEELGREVDALKSLTDADILSDPGHRKQIKHISDEVQRLSSRFNDLATALKKESDALGAILHKCGIALLPDEVLTTIFEMVVELTGPEDTKLASHKWKTSIRLSHINRRFRSIMLACPNFWTNMNSSLQMAAACLQRTKGLPLSVELMICDQRGTDSRTFEPILAELLPVTEQWGRLHMKFCTTFSFKRNCELDTLITHMIHRVNAPILEELFIEHKDYVRGRSPQWDWSKWNTPGLRRLKVESCFPLSLPALSTITSLELKISVADDQMSTILKEISRMGNLQDLAVEFLSTESFHSFTVHERVEFPQVQRLKIKTAFTLRAVDGNMAFKSSIFNAISFPNAVRFQLEIEGLEYRYSIRDQLGVESSPNFYFHKEIYRIFRHIHQFPRVEKFYLNISSPKGGDRERKVRAKLALPLNMLPSLKDFTFRCNTCFDLSEPDDGDEVLLDHVRVIPPRVVGDAFPALNTVTLDVFEASVVARWLGEYLMEMKGRGKWDEFRKLMITEHVGKDLRTTTIPGDDALQWCKNTSDRNEA